MSFFRCLLMIVRLALAFADFARQQRDFDRANKD